MQTKRFILTSILVCIFSLTFGQGGGMWIPTELPEKDMKNLGLKLKPKQLFENFSNTSINNAIAHFNGGCTSEVISPQGLLLTNHHCGYGQIQSHSTLENDYLQNGFWAKDLQSELPNKDLYARFIISIEDVTEKVMQGIDASWEYEKRQNHIKDNIEILTQNAKRESWQEASIKPFYDGNKYYMFITETYPDVRLVGAPPSFVGKFGSDTDNWVWPRHTGDFSLFRIYADKNNRPAEYSPDNVPYKPKHFLPVSAKGLNEGDFTMVYGFPGRTQEYLPAAAMEQITQTLNPARIAIRDAALEVMDKAMRTDPAVKIQFASKQARIANYWKKWKGENLGIEQSNAIELRKEYENKFLQKAQNNADYKALLPQLNTLYQQNNDYALANELFVEAIIRNSETLRAAYYINRIIYDADKPKYEEVKNSYMPRIMGIYGDYNAEVNQNIAKQVLNKFLERYPKNLAEESLSTLQKTGIDTSLIENSLVNNTTKFEGKTLSEGLEEWAKDPQKLQELFKDDALVQMIGDIWKEVDEKVIPNFEKNNYAINDLQKEYMKAQLELMSDEKTFFPDANSTLRITYGQIKGYSPRDAIYYEPFTHIEGIEEKYIPGDYEFDVDSKMLSLIEVKDFGNYTDDTGSVPVNFLATNHTTGGNSGSPALDAKGNLIGLNFDRVWEGTMSDLHYDPEICRNIMVDTRYILFIIDKYANANRLIEEMKIVQ